MSRLLAGSIRDPLVGRDVLIGVLIAIGDGLVIGLHALARRGRAAAIVSGRRLEQSVGRHRRLEQPAPRRALCALADHRLGDEHPALGYDDADLSIAVGVLRAPPAALARDRGADPGFDGALHQGPHRLGARQHPGRSLRAVGRRRAVFVAVQTAVVLAAVRFGLLTILVAQCVSVLLTLLPIAIDSSVPYASSSRLIVLTVIALAAYGWHTALAGRPMFGGLLRGVEPAGHA